MKKPTDTTDPAPWVPPRITNRRVERQMRGKGFRFKDGYPVHLPPGRSGPSTFSNAQCVYQFDQDGALFLVWERTTWHQQRKVHFEAIIDQPLVLAGLEGGKLAKSMFRFHHNWINFMLTSREAKMERVRNVSPKVAAKRVAWFIDGGVIHTTTIGDALAQSLLTLEAATEAETPKATEIPPKPLSSTEVPPIPEAPPEVVANEEADRISRMLAAEAHDNAQVEEAQQQDKAEPKTAEQVHADRFLTAELEQAARILEATKTYPSGWPRTKRTGYPYLRYLRRHAGIPNITRRERDHAAELNAAEEGQKHLAHEEMAAAKPEKVADAEDQIDKSDHDALVATEVNAKTVMAKNEPDAQVIEAELQQAVLVLHRDRKILEALRTYPANARYTRKGWPWLRALRKHAGFRITREERNRLWPATRGTRVGSHS